MNISRKRSQNHLRLHFTSKETYKFDTRDTFEYSCMRCSCVTENNNRQSDKDAKKEIFTNNQDKKYNSMKHLKGQQFLFTKTCIESELKIRE